MGGDNAVTTRGLVAGLAAGLAVLGTAIVINGIRGKRSGGSSGRAVVIAIALVGAGVVNGFTSVDFITEGPSVPGSPPSPVMTASTRRTTLTNASKTT